MNQELFGEFRLLGWPNKDYAITASGPLGIRGVRKISDIDVIASPELWHTLSKTYKITKFPVRKIIISPKIEVIDESSLPKEPGDPTTQEQLESAEVIDGLSFVQLKYILHWKQKMNRPKDSADIRVMKQLLLQNNNTTNKNFE